MSTRCVRNNASGHPIASIRVSEVEMERGRCLGVYVSRAAKSGESEMG